MDIGKASCRFLADAVHAKAELESYPGKLEALAGERERILAEMEGEVETADKEIHELDFSEKRLDDLRRECRELEVYTEKLRSLEQQESQTAVIKAKMEGIQINISNAEKNPSELKSRALDAESEKGKYADSYLEHEKIHNQMEGLRIWVQKESEIPVIREKRANAERRAKELAEEILSLDAELDGKRAQGYLLKKCRRPADLWRKEVIVWRRNIIG